MNKQKHQLNFFTSHMSPQNKELPRIAGSVEDILEGILDGRERSQMDI